MATSDWNALAGRLTATLHPTGPPIAITFSDERPSGVAPFDAPMAEPLPDGRTGRVPAGCVFWIEATGATFSTVAEDHGNCSVGSVTHGFKRLEDVAGNSDVAALLEAGWVGEADMPGIPVVADQPGAITYGPLADTPFDPDVVLLRLTAKSVMALHAAVPAVRFEGKPQCHIVAMAKDGSQVAVSVGCALSRVRTGMGATEMTCAIPAGRVAEVADALDASTSADRAVAAYAAADASRFA
jgi:uncharacterized protein (DUF169 family)